MLGLDPIPACLLGLLALQPILFLLSRVCSHRRDFTAALLGSLSALFLLSPWLSRDADLLAPTSSLYSQHQLLAAHWDQPESQHGLLNDPTLQFVPWELEVRRALRSRHLPFWSDRLGGGSSPWANPQARVLDPLAFIARIVAPIQHHLLLLLALQIALATEGAVALSRRLGTSRIASLLVGLSYGWSGSVIG